MASSGAHTTGSPLRLKLVFNTNGTPVRASKACNRAKNRGELLASIHRSDSASSG
jgi:hypothetical protein